jgi:hypothetical protein
MNPVVANAVMSVAPELARYAGLYELSPSARSYGAAPTDAGTLTFGQAARFSAISTSIVLASTLMGYALDEQITKRLALPGGWGPVVGAATAIAGTNAVAGLAQGVPASVGYVVGSVGPLVPTAIAAYALKKTTRDTGAVYLLAGLAAASALYGISKGLRK